MKTTFKCFACGKPMQAVGTVTGYCNSCDVMETRELRFNRVTAVTWQDWYGERLFYVDHPSGYHPCP